MCVFKREQISRCSAPSVYGRQLKELCNSHNYHIIAPLTGWGQRRQTKFKGRFRKEKQSQRPRNLTRFLPHHYAAKNGMKTSILESPSAVGSLVAGAEGGDEMRAQRYRRDGAGAGAGLRGRARSGGDFPRVPQRGGSGASCPGRRVWPGAP